jgi:hypothetical protein
MTAQIHDTVRYQGRDFDITGVSGSGMFDPEEHGFDPTEPGFNPVAMMTSCYRGFFCGYEVAGGRLLLQDLHMMSKPERGEGPKLFGKKPEREASLLWGLVYYGLGEPMLYTGGLLLGANFIEEAYAHMGFQAPHGHRQAHELIFEHGRLVRERDPSKEMSRFREEFAARSPDRVDEDPKDFAFVVWILDSFDLDYRLPF